MMARNDGCENQKTGVIAKTRESGFTLIELAIVMMVVGLMLAGFIKAYSLYKQNQIRIEQDKVLEKVHAALADYVRRNGEYPCPADPALRPGQANYGLESKTGANCNVIGGIVQFQGHGAPVDSVTIGALPAGSLQLPYYLMSDAYDNKLTYAVSETLVDAATFDANAGQIRVLDGGGNIIDTDFHFVILSHGPDGKGSSTRFGSDNATACTGSAVDVENCDFKIGGIGDAQATTFIDAEYAEMGSALNANHYDDTISYTLARKEGTMWFMTHGGTGELNISNRNLNNNVGIGLTTPTAKLHVDGGNIRSEQDVVADQDVNASRDVRAAQDVEAGAAVRSPVYYYQ